MISLITSSTTDPSQSINQSILVSKFLSIAKKLISPKKFIHDTSHGFPILVWYVILHWMFPSLKKESQMTLFHILSFEWKYFQMKKPRYSWNIVESGVKSSMTNYGWGENGLNSIAKIANGHLCLRRKWFMQDRKYLQRPLIPEEKMVLCVKGVKYVLRFS